MDKDETIVNEGTVEEDDMLLDFDLDDLSSGEGTDGGDDDDIIELVDLVEEDEPEAMETGEAPDDEISRLLEGDSMETAGGGEETGVEIPDEFENMLDDVDLDETEAEIDMSDVALDLDFGTEESGEGLLDEADQGLDADLDAMLDEEPAGEGPVDLNATFKTEVPTAESSEPPALEEAAPVLETEDEAGEGDITDDELQRMLEDEDGVDLDLDLSSDEIPDQDVPSMEPEGEDITEEALERMLEDEEGEAPEEPLEDQIEKELAEQLEVPVEEPVEEEPALTEVESFEEEAVPVEAVEEAAPPAPVEAAVSEERIAEIVRGVVEEVVAREVQQAMADVAERVIRESLSDVAEGVIRESVTEAAERVIRETIDALKATLETVED